MAFVVPIGFAFERLAKRRIACSNSDSILLAGKVTHAFFDKTGKSSNLMHDTRAFITLHPAHFPYSTVPL